eukprot:1378480-Amorphochlora_amoeboformis.AAC.1
MDEMLAVLYDKRSTSCTAARQNFSSYASSTSESRNTSTTPRRTMVVEQWSSYDICVRHSTAGLIMLSFDRCCFTHVHTALCAFSAMKMPMASVFDREN